MDPHPPFDHPHHRRGQPGHHYPDPHHRHYADQHLAGGIGGGAAPAGSRYEHDSHPIQYLPSDHLPPPPLPPPPPHHRLEAPHYAPLPLHAPPETYSPTPPPPPYRDLSPHHRYHPQRHDGHDFRAADEIRRVHSHHHYHHHHHHQRQEQQQHYHHQLQLPWEEAEEKRRRYAAPQLRLSPSDSRKRNHCALHDSGDLESTSSSGPPPCRQRQHLHSSYSSDENFVDRTSAHSGYSRNEGFVMHSDSTRKIQTSASTMLPDSPHKIDAGFPRRALLKSTPARLSVWQRIEENPSVYAPSSPHQLSKEVHISPSKRRNAGYASKELASEISLDCKAISPSKMKSTGSASKELPSVISLDHKAKSINDKDTVEKNEKALASVLVKKPSPELKEKGKAVKQAPSKSDKVQNNVPGFSNGSAGLSARPGTGVKKVKKIVIKKIVRKIGASNKQTSSPVIPEQKDGIDANADDCEKEEGEITTSSFGKADISISTSDTAGMGNNVVAEKEQNDCLMNSCNRDAASAIESVIILDKASDSGRQHPKKEDNRSLQKTGDTNATSVVDSAQILDTIGRKHPENRDCMDSGGQSAALLCENGTSHIEEDDVALSGAINAAVGSNSPRMPDTVKLHEYNVPEVTRGNNAACVNGGKDDAKQAWESMDNRRENSNILVDSNGEDDLFRNNSFASPNTVEASVTTSKDVHREEGSEIYVASLGDSMETSKIAEPSLTQDTHKEEGTVLTSPRAKGSVAVSPCGTLNGVQLSVNDNIQDNDDRIPMELSKANTSVTQHVNPPGGLEASVNEDIQEKHLTSIELGEAASSVTLHKKAPNEMEFSMNENIQKKESHMSIDSNTSKTTQHIEAPNPLEIFSNKVFGSELCRGHNDTDETHIAALDSSIHTLNFVLAGGAEDSCSQEHLHDQKIVLHKSNLQQEAAGMEFSNFPLAKTVESSLLLLDGNPTEDSSGPIILNNDSGKDTIAHLHRADLSPANSEQYLPTALTLGNNTYFSSARSEQPKENHKVMESNKGLDDLKVAEFGRIGKGKSECDNDQIKADAHNWLTLLLAINNVNNDATVSLNRFDLEKNVDEDTSVSQDHGSTADMDQRGSTDCFNGEDQSLNLSCSNVSQSDLLALKERDRNIENGSEIVLQESSVCSVNVLDQYGCCTTDNIDNTNKPTIVSSQSAGVTGVDLATSQVYVDSGHMNHSNTMNSVVESSTKPDLSSSWMEAIVSEATKEHQPCKSTPDMLFGLKEDTRKALPDPLINSASKSPPRMTIASSMVSKVPTKLVALPGSSREVPRLNKNARHRTWHRDSVSSCKSHLPDSQPSVLPPKLPLKKNGKYQNCYIRKGNSLVRNPATGNHPQSSSGPDAPSIVNKRIMKRSMNFVREVDINGTVANSNVSVERPKTPPLLLHTKSISMNISEPLSQSLQKQKVPDSEKKGSSGHVNSFFDNPSGSSMHKSEHMDAGKEVCVRPKSNQIVDSQGQQSGDSINSSMDKVLLQPSTAPDLYFKKRKNQIILGSSTSDVLSSKEMSQAENSNTGETKVIMFTFPQNNKNSTVAKDRPHRALQKTNTAGSFSHVWTLSGQLPQRKPFVGTSHVKAFPRILPWKRKVFSLNYRSNYSPLLNTSSLGIVRKLLKTRKRGTVYTVSTDGFSLRKSGLLSCDGSSLKWSRSLQKGSQKEATHAVAETARKKKERRKRQSLRNKERNDQYSPSVEARGNNHISTDSRVPSTCNEYVRINKGNQLVRNPKKVIRMLASEKVRWSLHTVRSRLAKKQQYCQFFTRFGRCKKSGGKCPYIHDRAKVAICTKFLKGLCSNASCKLTHKVLPERMPDCSYFLRGLCSNTTCPYRHVKVNTNAPVCEDFLKGYCADGDECRKKHSYVCPVFEATGECPQQSRCKLHHPKKKIESKRSRVDTLQNNSWGRYFDSSIGEDSEAMKVCSGEEDKQKLEHATAGDRGGDLADFIDLGAHIDGSVDEDAPDDVHLMELDSKNTKMEADNLDTLIKPFRIMRTSRV